MWLRAPKLALRLPLRSLGIAALLALVGMLALLGSYRTLYTVQLSGRNHAGELGEASLVCQTFVADYSRLSQVEVRLVTFGEQLDSEGQLRLHLRATPASTTDLATATAELTEIEDNSFEIFAFDPVRASVGQELAFCLQLEGVYGSTSLSVGGTTADTYPQGGAHFDAAEGLGMQDLAFRIQYTLTVRERFQRVAERLTEAKPYLLAQPWVYVILSLGCLGLLGHLIASLREADDSTDGLEG